MRNEISGATWRASAIANYHINLYYQITYQNKLTYQSPNNLRHSSLVVKMRSLHLQSDECVRERSFN